jgi:multidrug efflux pump subunit AcrB
VRGPFFNDEFTDVYAVLYALQGPGLPQGDLQILAEQLRRRLQTLPGVNKVDVLGRQAEQLQIEFNSQRLAQLGLNPGQLMAAIAQHNLLQPSGEIGSGERHAVRVNTTLRTLEELGELPLALNGRQLRLRDVATLRCAQEDPQRYTIRRNGVPALAIGLTLVTNGDLLALGQTLQAKQAELDALLPAGVTLERYADQPQVADAAVWEFEKAFLEALVIVLAVCFLFLGWRSGVVVAASVPLVLALVAAVMFAMGWALDRISLGALIIALGLLVDDAIIAVEMMVVKIEEGWDRVRAAGHAWTATAFPMLSGTLITIAGFMPVGFAKSISGEYAGGIFWVVGVALIASWLVAVVFTPYLGVLLLPKVMKAHAEGLYAGPWYQRLRRAVAASVEHRGKVLLATLAGFLLAGAGMVLFVQQQFFPTASRPELMVELRLREGASFSATATQAARLEAWLAKQPEQSGFTLYTGAGSPRFYLSLSPELPNAAYAQFVVQTPGLKEREALRAKLMALFDADELLPDARGRVTRLEFGPPVGFPVQFRIHGADPTQLRQLATKVRDRVRESQLVRDVQLDWFEQVRRLQVDIDLAQLARVGLSPAEVQQALQLSLSGAPVTQLRLGEDLIDVLLRGDAGERQAPEQLANLKLFARNGAVVPLGQVATIREGFEEPVLWRRNREPFISVRADVVDGVQGPFATKKIAPLLDDIALPPGYRIEWGGAIEEAAKSDVALFKVFPAMFGVTLLLLMLQLRSFKRVGLVFLTAPLGVIGAVPALLAFNAPFGFVALLGLIALGGMIQRNAVILVDQIDRDIAAGSAPLQAIVEATVRRARPVVLTAAAAVLAMIPLTRSVFWGPMAITIMGGLIVATVLTLVVVPALYAAFQRLPRGSQP